MERMKLSVIIPIYNEQNNIGGCLQSLINQSFKNKQIIVVDDGSTDETLNVISKYDDGSFKILVRPKHEKGNIQRVPYVLRNGSQFIDGDFNFIAILDADTILEENYYSKLIEKLVIKPQIGIAGGELKNQPETGLILGLIPYVFGCNRVYTRECWLKINDGKVMKPVPSWDTYHNIYARMLGYDPKRFGDVVSWSLRLARTSTPFEKGYNAFQLGYYPWFILGRSIKDFSPSMFSGYLKAYYRREEQFPIKSYVRSMEMDRIKRIFNYVDKYM